MSRTLQPRKEKHHFYKTTLNGCFWSCVNLFNQSLNVPRKIIKFLKILLVYDINRICFSSHIEIFPIRVKYDYKKIIRSSYKHF